MALGLLLVLLASGAAPGAPAEDGVFCRNGSDSGLASFAFGTGVAEWSSGWPQQRQQSRMVEDTSVWWVTEIDEGGLALCTDTGLQLWRHGDHTQDVSLAPLSTPVGAIYFEGKIWIACFGSWPTPSDDSGVAVVDAASGQLLETYPFSASGDADDAASHVHNIYLFEWGGRTEMFIAVLGNPWESPPVPGKGLVLFDRSSGAFSEVTTKRLNVRSAAQQTRDEIFVLTQDCADTDTKLALLRRSGDKLHVAVEASLPPRHAVRDDIGGGADVVLGREPGSVWCTDRNAEGRPGKLYYYKLAPGNASGSNASGDNASGDNGNASGDNASNGNGNASGDNGTWLELVAAYDTGPYPRYFTILDTPGNEGDIVVCNHDHGTLSVFSGLALHPTTPVEPSVIATVDHVAFFLQGGGFRLCPSEHEAAAGGQAGRSVLFSKWARETVERRPRLRPATTAAFAALSIAAGALLCTARGAGRRAALAAAHASSGSPGCSSSDDGDAPDRPLGAGRARAG